MPLGLVAGAAFESVAIAGLEDGDIVALFTDGIVESVDDGSYYGPERALGELSRHRHESAADIVHHLCQAAQVYANGPQADDMTVVVCRVGARPPEAGDAPR